MGLHLQEYNGIREGLNAPSLTPPHLLVEPNCKKKKQSFGMKMVKLKLHPLNTALKAKVDQRRSGAFSTHASVRACHERNNSTVGAGVTGKQQTAIVIG